MPPIVYFIFTPHYYLLPQKNYLNITHYYQDVDIAMMLLHEYISLHVIFLLLCCHLMHKNYKLLSEI